MKLNIKDLTGSQDSLQNMIRIHVSRKVASKADHKLRNNMWNRFFFLRQISDAILRQVHRKLHEIIKF